MHSPSAGRFPMDYAIFSNKTTVRGSHRSTGFLTGLRRTPGLVPASRRLARLDVDVDVDVDQTRTPTETPTSFGPEQHNLDIFDGPASDQPKRLFPVAEVTPKTKAPGPLDDELNLLRADIPTSEIRLVDEFLELAAAEKKTGKITASRRLNETAALLELRQEIGPQRWRYGIEAANRASAPNLNYVTKAATSWTKEKEGSIGGFAPLGDLIGSAPRVLGKTADDDPTNPQETVMTDDPQWLKDKITKWKGVDYD